MCQRKLPQDYYVPKENYHDCAAFIQYLQTERGVYISPSGSGPRSTSQSYKQGYLEANKTCQKLVGEITVNEMIHTYKAGSARKIVLVNKAIGEYNNQGKLTGIFLGSKSEKKL